VKTLPMVPITGWDATGAAMKAAVTEKLIPALERKGVGLFFPTMTEQKPVKLVPFSDLGVMKLRERPYSYSIPQFVFMLSGKGWIYVRGKWYRLREGQGAFLPKDCLYFPHGMAGDTFPEGQWLWIGIHTFGATIHQCRLVQHTHYHSPIYAVVDERIFCLFQAWETEAITRGNPTSLVSKSLLVAMFQFLSESTPIPVSVWAEVKLTLPELPKILKRAILQIVKRYETPCRLEKLAKHCGVSPFYLCKLFQKHLGVTPRTFLQRLRLKVAKRMLIETRLSPYKISQLVGYSNYGHFRKQFIQFFGVAPSAQLMDWSLDAKVASLVSKIVP